MQGTPTVRNIGTDTFKKALATCRIWVTFDLINSIGLQAKKLRNVTSAFEAFERIAATPGKAEITVVELRVRLSSAAPLRVGSALSSNQAGTDKVGAGQAQESPLHLVYRTGCSGRGGAMRTCRPSSMASSAQWEPTILLCSPLTSLRGTTSGLSRPFR